MDVFCKWPFCLRGSITLFTRTCCQCTVSDQSKIVKEVLSIVLPYITLSPVSVCQITISNQKSKSWKFSYLCSWGACWIFQQHWLLNYWRCLKERLNCHSYIRALQENVHGWLNHYWQRCITWVVQLLLFQCVLGPQESDFSWKFTSFSLNY